MHKGGILLSVTDSTGWTGGNKVSTGKNYYNYRMWSWICQNYGPIRFINKGIGGVLSSDVIKNIEWTTNVGSPDLVIVGLGMNDCANQANSTATYQNNLTSIYNAIKRRNPNALVIFCTPNNTTDATRTPYIASYQSAMASTAQTLGVPCAHFENAWAQANTGTYTADGIHPNDAGQGLIWTQVLQPLVQATPSIMSLLGTFNN